MRLFNLTDVETPQLKELGLSNTALLVGRHIVPPGEVVELPGASFTMESCRHFVGVGAMSLDVLPPAYVVAKEQKKDKKDKKGKK